ncbi:PREDICTED: putative protein TPRXL [Haliaeetus leucocephalus]|uniref:putative protein TPRXL n=1 Tax=Haliaeetus leucocephalus TaxID=52644 RepID=UPI00053CD409|nr:PREDICTED: putative protein TPRXL [Haliaeetus leucocephalus]
MEDYGGGDIHTAAHEGPHATAGGDALKGAVARREESMLKQNKDLTMKGKSDLQSSSKVSEEEEGDYETVSSSTLEAIHALRILPAKPLQESEYADKRCLRPSSTTSPMKSQHTSQPPQYSAASEDAAKAVSTTSSSAADKQPVLSYKENAQPSSHLSNISKSHKGLSQALQNLSPQTNGSFACKIALAATEGATTPLLRRLRAPTASPSQTPRRPPQHGGDPSQSDAHSSLPKLTLRNGLEPPEPWAAP